MSDEITSVPATKTVADSRTEQVQILSQETLNGYRRLFGGKLMQWIDVVAAVVARRHCNRNVTTAAVDSLDFTAAAYANDTLVLVGYITYTGRTSMEVCVKTYVESLDGSRRMINQAYVVMVALDEQERPAAVPQLRCVSEAERQEWAHALERNAARKRRRAQRVQEE